MTLDELIKQLREVKKHGVRGDTYICVYQDGIRHAICDNATIYERFITLQLHLNNCIDINLKHKDSI